MKPVFLLMLVAGFLQGCSLLYSDYSKVDPKKRIVRYIDDSGKNEMAYSVKGPNGDWMYRAPKYEARDAVFFYRSGNIGLAADVSFRIDKDIGLAAEMSQYFFLHGKFSEKSRQEAVTVGTQGIRCIKNDGGHKIRFGPSRDPSVSGKWAGQGVTHYVSQAFCPFHFKGEIYTLVMSKNFFMKDVDADGVDVDQAVRELNKNVDESFESFWDSILFNPEISQAPDDQIMRPLPPPHVDEALLKRREQMRKYDPKPRSESW